MERYPEWAHQFTLQSIKDRGQKVGQIDFGPQAANPVDQLQLRWFDFWPETDPEIVAARRAV